MNTYAKFIHLSAGYMVFVRTLFRQLVNQTQRIAHLYGELQPFQSASGLLQAENRSSRFFYEEKTTGALG